jgi:hypothetical protein
MALEPKVKQKWVKALKSGKYKQGHGTLKEIDANRHAKYCCLGVLADTQGVKWEKHLDGDDARVPYLNDHRISRDDASTGFLANGMFGLSNAVQEKLANMNDGAAGLKKYTFKEIVKYIEQEL